MAHPVCIPAPLVPRHSGHALGGNAGIAHMNAILFLVVFSGTLAAVWAYPGICSHPHAWQSRHGHRWLRWVPLANLCLLRPLAKTSLGALLTLVLVLVALASSMVGLCVVLARFHMPVHVSAPIVITALWLIGITACVAALRWSLTPVQHHFWLGLILIAAAGAIGYLGLRRIWVDWVQTINARTIWRLDSRWAFVVLLVLSAATLAWTLWRRWRAAPNPKGCIAAERARWTCELASDELARGASKYTHKPGGAANADLHVAYDQ